MFLRGFAKIAIAQQPETEPSGPRKAFVTGTAIGAGVNVAHDAYLNHIEKKLPNRKSVKAFSKHLLPGDIVLTGSPPKNSGGTDVSDLPIKLRRFAKNYLKLRGDTTLLSNSALLTSIGGGGKYHAGIYLGRGRIGHMTTDQGITADNLHVALKGQNAAAYRFGDASRRETKSAVRYVEQELKKKTPYQGFHRYAPQAISNLVSPMGLKTNRKRGGGLVCNTVPIRAYHKRKFGPQGEWTYTGDLRRAPGLNAVARRDTVRIPTSLKARGVLGQASKGLKWGLAGAGATALYQRLKKKPEST